MSNVKTTIRTGLAATRREQVDRVLEHARALAEAGRISEPDATRIRAILSKHREGLTI